MKKKIYIAYTGGTIGMALSDCGYLPKPGLLAQQLKVTPEFYLPEMPAFTLHEYPTLIDSADVSPSHWKNIADDIAENYQNFDGFVILHGTDTMAYSASALSFLLQGLNKPVIFTGAQIPINQLHSDAKENLIGALRLASHSTITEVCLYFNRKLYRGNRTRKIHSTGMNAFSSPNYPLLASVGVEIKLHQHLIRAPSASGQPFGLTPMPTTLPKIAAIRFFPGISATLMDNLVSDPLQGLILESYGVGNIPVSDKALLKVLKRASQRGVIIVNCSQCFKGGVDMNSYVAGHALREIGVISAGDMTPEAVLAKLHALLGQQFAPDVVRQQMQINLCGECSA